VGNHWVVDLRYFLDASGALFFDADTFDVLWFVRFAMTTGGSVAWKGRSGITAMSASGVLRKKATLQQRNVLYFPFRQVTP
jgi:hypothetical protein